MTNNDILRRIRYTFDFNDAKMIALYKLGAMKVTRAKVSAWLINDEDPSLIELTDKELAAFLNGLIIENRGKREGPPPVAEEELTNNMILRKLKIALNLKSEDVLALYKLIGKKISKHELSAFFRHPDNKSYEPCLDQYLRYFLSGMQEKYRSKLGK